MTTGLGRSAVAALAVMFLLFAGYDLAMNYAAHSQQLNPQAAEVVRQQLIAEGITPKRALCQSDSGDPRTLPAVEQIAALHPGEKLKLYRCNAELPIQEAESLGTNPSRSYCVVGFSGPTPWQAIQTPWDGCASLAPHAS